MLTVTSSLLGLIATLGALFFPEDSRSRRALFLGGAILLLISSILARHGYFISLEILVVSGCASAFIAGYRRAKRILFAIAGAVVLVLVADLSSLTDILGGVGLVAVALGYATTAPIWYALGSLAVGTRAWIEFGNEPLVLPAVFGLLNWIFVLVCVIQMKNRRRISSTDARKEPD